MWVCLNNGFVSIVEDWEDPTKVYVRARVEKHLHAFMVHSEVQRTIAHTPNNDYEFRIHMTKEEAAATVSKHLMNIDYTNFKNSVEDSDLHYMYNEVWASGVRNLDKRPQHRPFKFK